MHKFTTIHGKNLWYDVRTNRISLYSSIFDQQTCPVVNFVPPTAIGIDRISMFTVEMTQRCNLRCKYCCYSGEYRDRRAHNNKDISFETLNHLITFIQDHYDKNAEEIVICFYGGEALLAKDKIEWFIHRVNQEIEHPVVFSLSSNALALNESVIDWICSYDNFLVNVTIDGDKIMHDANRVKINGQGSYEIIINNLRIFKKKYPNEYKNRVRFLSTVNSWNDVLTLSEVWDKEDVLYHHYPVHISHIIPNFNDVSRTYDSRDVKDNFFSKAIDSYIKGEDGILSSSFKRLINPIAHRNFCHLSNDLTINTCFQDLWSTFINVDGDVYACEKFCGKAKIGDVFNGYNQKLAFDLLYKFTDRKNNFCSQCWAMRFCRMCMTSLNHTDSEVEKLCVMERDTIDIALRYYCELKDREYITNLEKI